MTFNNEIEEMKAQIQVLQNKLEELEKRPSPAEEAFKEFYGAYPITDIVDTSWDSDGWVYFEAGYNAAYKEKVVKQKDDYPYKKYTPEETEQSLKEAFREAVKQGIIHEVDKVSDVFMNEMVEKLKGQTLYDVIADWWDDTFTKKETSLQELVDAIEEWLPKEQSAAGSQNVYVECTVEGFNDCLTKIRENLR